LFKFGEQKIALEDLQENKKDKSPNSLIWFRRQKQPIKEASCGTQAQK